MEMRCSLLIVIVIVLRDLIVLRLAAVIGIHFVSLVHHSGGHACENASCQKDAKEKIHVLLIVQFDESEKKFRGAGWCSGLRSGDETFRDGVEEAVDEAF